MSSYTHETRSLGFFKNKKKAEDTLVEYARKELEGFGEATELVEVVEDDIRELGRADAFDVGPDGTTYSYFLDTDYLMD